jgi:hypothetical protein
MMSRAEAQDLPPRPVTPLGFSTDTDMEDIPLHNDQSHSGPSTSHRQMCESLRTCHLSSLTAATRHSYRHASLEDALVAREDLSHFLTSHFLDEDGFDEEDSDSESSGSESSATDNEELTSSCPPPATRAQPNVCQASELTNETANTTQESFRFDIGHFSEDECDSDGSDSCSEPSLEESNLEEDLDFVPLLVCPPPYKPSYSCLPSPLSLSPTSPSWSPCHARHNYPHRGHSRRSFHLQKAFWSAREEEWARTHEQTAYDGLDASIFTQPTRPLRTRGTKRESGTSPADDVKHHQQKPPRPPMSAYPRWGDFSCLRDSLCAHMDRTFVDMPLWTLRKALWMFDLHVAASRRRRTVEELDDSSDDEEEEEDMSDSCLDLMAVSALTELSNDSDVTLVDESETAESSLDAVEGKDEEDKDYMFLENVELCNSSDTYCSGSSSSLPSCSTMTQLDYLKLGSMDEKPAKGKAEQIYAASVDWYRRFDLLCELTRLDEARRHPPTSILINAVQ